MRVFNLALICGVVGVFSSLASCSDPAEKAGQTANACGMRSCPSGTRPEETRSLAASNDISGGYDPATYKAEGAYKREGTGACEYACVVTQPCPENTFPIISPTCFTCGAVTAKGIDQGVCSDEATVATECGKQECPVGTGVVESRSVEGGKGYDVSNGFDPNTYDPNKVAYLTFDKGDCAYQCSPLQACPSGTFPVITADCFTCGAIIGDDIKQATCKGVESNGSSSDTTGNGAGGAGGAPSGTPGDSAGAGGAAAEPIDAAGGAGGGG